MTEDRSLGDRAADRMRFGMGSWPFVFVFLAFMGVWAFVNHLMGPKAFDPYPYILLNLLLSTLAGLQGAILLISAKRADALSQRLAEHMDDMSTRDYDLDSVVAVQVAAIHAHLFDG